MGMTVDSYWRESYRLTSGLLAAHAWYTGADGKSDAADPVNKAAQSRIDAIALADQQRAERRKPKCPTPAARPT